MLNGHIASYLNTKVKNYIRSNPEIDIHILTKEVFDQLSELMQTFIETKLIDTKLAKTGSNYIDLFLKLDKPRDVLFLTRMKEINVAGPRGFNFIQTQISLEYFFITTICLPNQSAWNTLILLGPRPRRQCEKITTRTTGCARPELLY